MATPPKPSVDPFNVFVHAERFYWADHYLRDERMPQDHCFFMAPVALVLNALSAELYLKCLLRIEHDKAPATHDLKDLFDRLPAPTRATIQRKWDAQKIERRLIEDQVDALLDTKVPRSLDYALETGRLGFNELRYHYELGEGGSIYWLSDLSTIIRETIMERKPEWIPPQNRIRPTFRGH